MAGIRKEQKGVMDERALILTILKLISKKDLSQAKDLRQAQLRQALLKLGQLSRLKHMDALISLVAHQLPPHQLHGPRHMSLQEGTAEQGQGDVEEEEAQDLDPDVYTKNAGGGYKYGMSVMDSEEMRVVKGIMLKILLELDDQEANLQKQQDLWIKVHQTP